MGTERREPWAPGKSRGGGSIQNQLLLLHRGKYTQTSSVCCVEIYVIDCPLVRQLLIAGAGAGTDLKFQLCPAWFLPKICKSLLGFLWDRFLFEKLDKSEQALKVNN